MQFFFKPLLYVLPSLMMSSAFAQDAEKEPAKAPEPETSVESLTVTGQRVYFEPSSNTRVRPEQLEAYKYTDLNRVLKTIPGVQVQEEDGFGLRPNIGMRGVAPHRSRKVLIMEDGIPGGPAPYSAPAAYYVLTPTLVESIEVNKGSSAVKYGPQTIGGAINLITKKIPSEPFAGSIDLGLGTYNFRKAVASIGGKSGSVGWLLLGSQLGSDGYKNLPNGQDTGFHKRDVLAKVSYDLTENQGLFLSTSYSDELSDETYLGLSRADFDADPYQRYAASERDQMKTSHRTYSLGHVWKSDNVTSKLTLYKRHFDRTWHRLDGLTDRSISVPDVLKNPVGIYQHAFAVLKGQDDSLGIDDQIFQAVNHRIYESQGAYWEGALDSKFAGSVSNKLEWGLRTHQDSIRHVHTAETFNMLSGRLVETGDAALTGAQDKISANALSAHVWDTVTLGDLRLSAGLRHEWVDIKVDDYSAANADETNNRSASMPGAGVFYQITPDLGALAGVYRGLGLAAADDKGSGDAEESINYEGGFRFLKRGNSLDLIGFYNDYSNIKGTCSVSEGCGNASADVSYNGGEAQIYGLELSAGTNPRLGSFLFPIAAEYTLTRASFQNTFVSGLSDWGIGTIREGDPIPYVPQHQFGLQAGVQWEILRLNLQAKYQSKSYDQALLEGREQLPSSTIWDAAFSVFPHETYELYATADNITNRKVLTSLRPFGARPGKPQAFVFGVKAQLN
ncbi:MAG: TonB-dependent receptor [Proteobacteria bacterium]|nr:MAG: TonB-dependent receptor [Pseudomonadota bacterium]